MDRISNVTLAGLTLPCAFRYAELASTFPKPDPDAPLVDRAPVALSEEDWSYYLSTGMEDSAYTEFSLLTACFSDALLPWDRMIYHAVALRWQEKAWLISAGSGVGKSTQASWLQTLRPGEFGIICGDRPVLSFHKNEVIVHPSPWNGKENWFGAHAAPLGGIILLSRGEENSLCRISPREAAISAFTQIIHRGVEPELVHRSAELVTRMLNAVPIWSLCSHDVPDSTRLLLDGVFRSRGTAGGT